MKIDHAFPPPPQFKQKTLPCSDLTPTRKLALERLEAIAAAAEALIGMDLSGGLPFAGTSRGFVLHCAVASRHVENIAKILSAPKIMRGDADDLEGVMLIDIRAKWGVLGPMRGDIVLLADGHASIVTTPLCLGCQHFESVSLTGEPPAVAKTTQWLAASKWIVRAIDESAAPLAVVEKVETPVVIDNAGNTYAEGDAPDMSEATSEPGDAVDKKTKKKRTGIG